MENAEERAYRLMIHGILSGEYNPGDFLLELEIAQKLEMSRTPVSRALGRLVSEGFLNKIPKKGCYIPIPTPRDAELVFTARQLVEGEAAALAAINSNSNDIMKLEEIIIKDSSAFEMKDKEAWANINEIFHLSIAKFSHNPYIEKWVQNMFWRSNVFVFYFDSFYKPSNVVVVHETPQQHREILEAIIAKNPPDARYAMKQHIHTTFSKLLLQKSIDKT